MVEALESWHMGQVFYAYRTHPWHEKVLSQEALATWLDLNQAQLSRIEGGKPPQDLAKLTRWAHSLRIPGDLLWFKLPNTKRSAYTSDVRAAQPEKMSVGTPLPVDTRTQKSDGCDEFIKRPTTSTSVEFDERDAMSPFNRRELLKSGASAAFLSTLNHNKIPRTAGDSDTKRRYTGDASVAYFGEILTKAKGDDGTLGPKETLPMVLGLLDAIDLRAREVKPQIRSEFLSLGAEGAEFAGWLYRDIQQPHAAAFWYDRAMEWAQEADNVSMQGYVLLKKSQMAYDQRDALRVLTLAQAAGHQRWQLPSRVRAEVMQQEALGRAMLGDPLDTVRRKLDAAADLLANTPEDAEALGAYFNGHTRMIRDAITLTEAGKPSMAVDIFSDALSANAMSYRDTGFFNARRAAALALSGEPDEAARVGAASAAVACEVKSGRTVRVLGDVLHILERWRDRPAVRELRDALVPAS
ncbi:XRE family transcriptional regulator [Streptomyces sp. AFD10]|uniref:XRE family transcriptional regulator n=1 Tax=Streptomyces sp. AFD10 TaxID=3050948 RepID=UPI0034DE8582